MNIIDWQRQGMETLSLRHGAMKYQQFGISRRPAISHEVDYLLSGIIGLSRPELYLNRTSEVAEEKGLEISQALEKRASGMPIQYILGEIEFFSLPFYLTPGVFIPRPETELLVEEAFSYISSPQMGNATPTAWCCMGDVVILDLCTGCGNIAISLAKNTNSKIIACDISSLSLKNARKNAIRHKLLDRIEFLQGDLFEPVGRKRYFNRFQLIISNPPYISSREWDKLPKEVKYYEPFEALFGGKEGLDFYKRIARDAKRFIKRGGHLLLEVGPARKAASILEKEGWQDIRITKDYNNCGRIISCRF